MSKDFDKKTLQIVADYKNYIKIFFEHFPSKSLDPQKSTFGDVILGLKLLSK